MSLVDLGKRLLEAAKQGLTDEVRTLMSNGAPFTTDWLGTSPLHFASQNGHVSTAEVLLRAGISRDARTKVDRTPLHVASQEGHSDVVDLLIKNGADIEAKDMLKMTPLHWSVEKGHVAVIELLLGHGADINTDNKFDKSPVEIAINNGRSDIAELLQLSRLPQQNVVEVMTDQTVVEEVAETECVETSEIASNSPINIVPTSRELIIGRETGAGDGTEQSSTAVLATLAALAEATGPLNSTSTANTTAAEALSWLESHGITMISGDAPTTLVESGQSLSLTEAGKLALDFVKQKVITVSTDQQGELRTEAGTPMVIRLTSTGEAVAEPVSEQDEPMLKKIKLESESGVITSEGVGSIPTGYVIMKAEPEDQQIMSIEGHGDEETEQIMTETVSEEGVTIDGGMILSSDGMIVSQAGDIEHDGLGITIQSDIEQCVQDGVVTEEEICHFEVDNVTEEVLQDDGIHQEIIEEQSGEEADAEEFRNRLDDITSKT